MDFAGERKASSIETNLGIFCQGCGDIVWRSADCITGPLDNNQTFCNDLQLSFDFGNSLVIVGPVTRGFEYDEAAL